MIHNISDALGQARQLPARLLKDGPLYFAPLAAILRENAHDPAVLGDQQRREALQ